MLTLVRRHLDRSIDTVGIGAASAQRRKRHRGPERRPAGPACHCRAGRETTRPGRGEAGPGAARKRREALPRIRGEHAYVAGEVGPTGRR